MFPYISYRFESIGYGFDIFELLLIFMFLGVFASKYTQIFNEYARKVYFSLFLVVCARVVSLFFGSDVFWGQYASLLRYTEVFVAIFVFQAIASSKKHLDIFMAGLLCATVVESVGDILIALAGSRGIFVGITGIVFQVFFMVYFLLRFLENKKSGTVFLIPLFTLSLLASQTRSLFISLGLSTLVSLWIFRKRIRFFRVVFSLIILTILAGGLFYRFQGIYEKGVNRSLLLFSQHSGSGVRYYLWDKALATFVDNPLTGIGSGGFARNIVNLPQYFYVDLPGEYSDIAYGRLGTHSTITNVLSETGLIGLLTYIMWLFAVYGVNRRALSIASVSEESALIVALVSLCLVTVVSDLWAVGSFGMVVSCLIGLLLGIVMRGAQTCPPSYPVNAMNPSRKSS